MSMRPAPASCLFLLWTVNTMDRDSEVGGVEVVSRELLTEIEETMRLAGGELKNFRILEAVDSKSASDLIRRCHFADLLLAYATDLREIIYPKD